MELVVMSCRKFVTPALFVLFISFLSGAAFAQTAPAAEQKSRIDALVKEALDRYNDGIRAAAQNPASQDPGSPSSAVATVPMTLEEAVRHAVDNNLELAVERLNPQTFDLTLASLRANYKPISTASFGRRDNVRPPTNLLNPGSPNV